MARVPARPVSQSSATWRGLSVLTPQQIEHARELIDKGEARHHIANLLSMDRVTLYRALTI
jgi:hypothetical protein